MADEPRLLEVGSDSRPETINAGQRVSEAIVENESRELSNSEVSPNNVNATNEQGQADVSTTPKALKVSKDTVKGVYVADTNRNTGFERSTADKKSIVNTITVDEVKQLLKELDAEIQARVDAIVETIRKGQYVEVSTTTYPTLESFLASSGEQGTVYLYPVGNVANNYYQYIWEVNQWISLGTTQIDLTNVVTTNTDQNISSIKTFDTAEGGNIIIKQNGIEKFAIYPDSNTHNTKLNAQGNTKIRFDSNQINLCNHTAPLTNGNLDLGVSSFKWRDLHLTRNLTDGTNSVTVADISNGLFNVINASDIVSNTLTQAQFDLITNDKPTLIKGTFLGIRNPILTSPYLGGGGYVYGLKIGQTSTGYQSLASVISQYRINVSSKLMETVEADKRVALEQIYSVNGKNIPAYPSDTGTFVLKCVDGVLTWVAE